MKLYTNITPLKTIPHFTFSFPTKNSTMMAAVQTSTVETTLAPLRVLSRNVVR